MNGRGGTRQWDQLVRVATSLRNRVVPAHVVLQRLSSASPSDRVAKALTKLGRIVKTIFITALHGTGHLQLTQDPGNRPDPAGHPLEGGV
jgi:hypothetical protein